MSEDTAPEGHSFEEYEKTLAYAEEHCYWAMYTAVKENGYDPKINWAELRRDYMRTGGPALRGRRLLNAVKSMAQTDHTPTLDKPRCKASHELKAKQMDNSRRSPDVDRSA